MSAKISSFYFLFEQQKSIVHYLHSTVYWKWPTVASHSTLQSTTLPFVFSAFICPLKAHWARKLSQRVKLDELIAIIAVHHYQSSVQSTGLIEIILYERCCWCYRCHLLTVFIFEKDTDIRFFCPSILFLYQFICSPDEEQEEVNGPPPFYPRLHVDRTKRCHPLIKNIIYSMKFTWYYS